MNKKFIVLGVIAAGLAGAAYFLGNGSKPSGSKLNGKLIFPGLDVSRIARIDCGKLALASKDAGWVVESCQDYPADQAKLAENLMALTELKVGQTVRGKKIGNTTLLRLKDAEGKEVASLALGERHPKYGHGRYVDFDGETVLVANTLDAFDGEPNRWIETKIVDSPYISFTKLAEPELGEEDFGFTTGVVKTVTIGGDTNRVMTIGNQVKGGSGRYVKLDNVNWVFEVPAYSVDKLLPKPEPKEEPKEEPKTESKPEAPKEG